MRQVSFIGLGAMGEPMAANLLKAGFPLKVFDVVQEKLKRLVELGGIRADNLSAAIRDADVVITMLPTTESVLEVVLGEGGVLQHISPKGIIMDMSTIAPTGTDHVYAECRKKNVFFIDSPVGRQVIHAIKGESLFMVGCDNEWEFNQVKPYLEAMGTKIVRSGGVGMGTRMKIVNNMQILTIAEVTAEAILLSEKLGLDLSLVKDVNAGTTATNGQMQFTFPTKVFSGDTDPGFTIELAHKDLTLAMEAAEELNIQLPSCSAAEEVYKKVKSGVFGKKDFSALLEYWCDREEIDTPRIN